jgi:hypothetical protein
MQDKAMNPAFAEVLSEIELDFFRNGDELDIPVMPEATWDNLGSSVHTPANDNDDDEWEWAIALARARRAPTAH